MTKKAKGQGSMGSMVTYHEMKKHDFGTKEARFGVDSQLPFGYCALTLAPVVEPVVTPSGHIYSREAIFEHMLTKTQELKKLQAAYDAQEAEKAMAHHEKVTTAADKDAAAFVSSQLVLHSSSSAPLSSSSSSASSSSTVKRRGAVAGSSVNIGSGVGAGDKRKAVEEEDDEEGSKRGAEIAQLSSRVGDRETLETLKSTSYWLPGFTPEHVKEDIPPPPKRPPSPNTGQQIRLKDLIPIVLKVDPDTEAVQDKKYQCAVTGKQISFQDVVLLKKANVVILESAYRDLCVKQGMICPITGQKLRPEKDVLRLVKPGSSFAAAGSVKSSKYSHTIT